MKGHITKRENRQRKLASALLLGAMGAITSEPAFAQEMQRVSTDERIQFDIASQPLSGALGEFARQAHVNALYFSDDLRGLSSPPLRGSFTRQQALDLLLARSGYNGRISGGNLVLAQEQAPRPQPDSAAPSGAETDQHEENSRDSSVQDETIVVTGTRIRGAAPAGANLITLDRHAIESRGRNTLQDVLQTLPQVFPGSQGEVTELHSTSPGGNVGLGSSVDLRGLGADATLTLLNGHRLAPAGFGSFVDISAIPLEAIERVEVLADGASATYGADAVGGVVNILLRRGLDHPETMLRYGAADGMNEIGFSHVLGGHWTGGSLIAGYEYRHRDSLAAADRSFADNSDLTSLGGSNFSQFPASPGNIIFVGATPVSLAIPTGQNGLTLTQADLIAGANPHNNNQDTLLLPEQESHGLFASVRQDLSNNFSVSLDVLASRRMAHAQPAQLGSFISVPETNYYRLQNGLFAGQGPLLIAYSFANDFGPAQSDTNSDTLSLTGAVEWRLASDWRIEASTSYGTHVDKVDNSNFADGAAIAAALASSNPATAFDPFGDGGDTPAGALSNLTFRQHIQNDSEMVTYALRADGSLFDLPGGAARAAFGVERRHQTFSLEFVEFHGGAASIRPSQSPGDRTTDAIYGELFIPFLSNAALSLSLRREESSDYGESTTPKIGVQWSPVPDLTLRGTWGTSFKAPDFTQLLGGTGLSIGSLPGIFDPNATNGSTGLIDITGANPNLKPEEAESWTAGFEYRPSWLDGFRFTATYFDIDFANRISTPGFILDVFQHPENYPGYLIRNPTPAQIAAALALTSNVSGSVPPDGIEAIFDERLTNLAALRARGVDLSASYTLQTPVGELSIFAAASDLLEYSRRNNPTLPSTDLLNTILNPIDWRGRAGATLDAGHWQYALTANYTNSYRDNLSTPHRDIDAWTTFDARVSRRFNVREDGSGAEISLDVRNLTDEDPPFANNPIGMGFDTLNASPVGRVVTLEIRQQW